jgi:hypothetical protein
MGHYRMSWDASGMTCGKCFGILVDREGGRVAGQIADIAVIAVIAVIARDRKAILTTDRGRDNADREIGTSGIGRQPRS